MNKLDEFDLGWLVGMLEGEGCFHSSTSRDGYKSICVSLNMTDKDVVYRVARVVGVGKVRGPYNVGTNPKWKQQYCWTITGPTAIELMHLVSPYMGERRKAKIEELLILNDSERARGREVKIQKLKDRHIGRKNSPESIERMRKAAYKRYGKEGQSLVEFALVIPLFLLLIAGLLDGSRLLFAYNEVQEAAHAGARWGAINVGRSPWGDSTTCGNYTMPTPSCTITSTGGISSTIIGQVDSKLIAVDKNQTTVNIDQSSLTSQQSGIQDDAVTRMSPVTVTVSYTFVPVLGFSHIRIPLVGSSTYYHE